MAKSKDSPPDQQPKIRFGGNWIPAHDLWKKMETVTAVMQKIDRFNRKFPELDSADTRDVVPLVRQRLKEIELQMPRNANFSDLTNAAAELLGSLTLEEAIDALAEQHGTRVDVQQLIRLAGEKPYLQSLAREAHEPRQNKVSPEQMAQLWNDLARPAPGGACRPARKLRWRWTRPARRRCPRPRPDPAPATPN